MNKKLWAVIIVFVLASSYGLYRVIFYNPIDSITKAKLDLSRPNSETETIANLATLSDLGVKMSGLIGQWQNQNNSKRIIEYQADQTVNEYNNGKLITKGTWQLEDSSNKNTGPTMPLLKVVINGETRSYQILNLSATNLSYITGSQEGIQSFKKLP